MPFAVGEVETVAANDGGGSAAQVILEDHLPVDQLERRPIFFAFDLGSVGTEVQQQTVGFRRPTNGLKTKATVERGWMAIEGWRRGRRWTGGGSGGKEERGRRGINLVMITTNR